MTGLEIIAIGRLKKDAEETLAERYLSRIQKMGQTAGLKNITINELPESQKQTADLRKANEAKNLQAKFSIGTKLYLLDENGKSFSSRKFASLLADTIEEGYASITFAIGGPDGLGDFSNIQNATKISLSKMTLPHGLARIILLEQIYRALTIRSGHPYHRD